MWKKTVAGRGRSSSLGQLEVFFHSLLIFFFVCPSVINLELGRHREVERGGKGTSMILSLEKQSGNVCQRNLDTVDFLERHKHCYFLWFCAWYLKETEL